MYSRNQVILFYLMAVIILSQVKIVSAQDQMAENALESSLMDLKKSIGNLAQENDRIKREVVLLKDETQSLRDELKSLGSQNDGLEITFVSQEALSDDLSLLGKQKEELEFELFKMTDEEKQLQGQKKEKEGYLKEMEKNLDFYSAEVSSLKEKLGAPFKSLNEPQRSKEKNQILSSLEASKGKNEELNKKWEKLKKKYAQPLSVLGSLKQERKMLLERLEALEVELRGVPGHERQDAQQEFSSHEDQESLDRLNRDIQKLNLQKGKLQTILAQAKEKLDGRNMPQGYSEEALDRLRENLELLKQENTFLRKN